MSTPIDEPPWAAPGWFDTAESWMLGRLHSIGVVSIDSYRQLAATSLHCLFEVQTSAGAFYFKAVRPQLAHEQKLSQMLSALDAIHFPGILGADNDRHWLLMRDVGGRPLSQVDECARWEEALRTFAEIQIEQIGREDSLLESGCADWRLDRLATQIGRLFSAIDSLKAVSPGRDGCASNADGRSLTRRLQALCLKLSSYAIPSSLVHGDFHPDNIFVTGRGCVYLDWSEGYVGHPFFTLADFLSFIHVERPGLDEWHARLRRAYLGPWSSYASADRLEEAFAISRVPAELCLIMRITRSILNLQMDSRRTKAALADELNGRIRRLRENLRLVE